MIPQDKANHIIYGFLIALGALLIAQQFSHPPFEPRDIALGAAAAVGLGKEVVDKLSNMWAIAHGRPISHGVEMLDFLATTAGGALVWLAAS